MITVNDRIGSSPTETNAVSKSQTFWRGALLCLLILCPLLDARARPPLPPYDTIPGQPPVVTRQPQRAALSPSDQQNPGYRWAAHSQGNIQLELNNHGEIGERNPYHAGPIKDPITGEYLYGCTYPRGSKLVYVVDAGPMIGGIVGRDTLVSAWAFNPELGSIGKFKFQSIDVNKRDIYSESARSELDLICEYYDTITRRDLVWTPYCDDSHIPLELKMTQRSMAWSGADLDDFILFEYEIETMGDQTINDVWIGVGYGNNIGHEYDLRDTSRYVPVRVGLLREWVADEACGYLDHPNVAYMMTKDGYPTNGRFDERSPLGAVGFMFLGTSYHDVNVYFNWQAVYYTPSYRYWFMPQRDLGMGMPPIDASNCQYGGGYYGRRSWLYATMSRLEIDYDQIDTIRGMDIAITTTARSDDEGRALLEAFSFPFKA